MQLTITILFVNLSVLGVNSFDLKENVHEGTKLYISDQDVKESGYLTDLVGKNYGKLNDNGYDKLVSFNKGVTYGDLFERDKKDYYDNDSKDKLGYGQLDKLDQKTIKELDEIYGFTGPTANDEPENLIRPCSLDDWQCVRKYFASNGHCTPSHGPVPDPFYIEKNTVFFSAVNVTGNFINFKIRGLSSAKINDFYVNKKSGNLVLAIDVQNLNISTPRTYIRFRRTAKESIVLADTAFVIFRTVTFTAVIPKVPKLRLDHADIHVDIDEPYPSFAFGPGIYNSTDPDVVTANAQFVALLPIIVREGLLFLSPLITGIYIQENICKFDINLISL